MGLGEVAISVVEVEKTDNGTVGIEVTCDLDPLRYMVSWERQTLL